MYDFIINVLNAATSLYVSSYISGHDDKVPDIVLFNISRLILVYTYYYPIGMCVFFVYVYYKTDNFNTNDKKKTYGLSKSLSNNEKEAAKRDVLLECADDAYGLSQLGETFNVDSTWSGNCGSIFIEDPKND